MTTKQEFTGLFSLYLWIAGGVAVVIFSLVTFALIHYRAGRGHAPSRRSEANSLEATAAVLIAITVALLVARTFSTESKVDATPASRIRVDVTAFRWGWRFDYPGRSVSILGNSGRQPTLAVPAGRRISFSIRSQDVIHSFWVPDERFKRDAIPGRVNHFDLTFGKAGRERGFCAEFCGLRHTNMGFWVLVLSPDGFRRWIDAHVADSGGGAA